MDDSKSPDSEPTTRTLLRRVLDSAVPRTPQWRLSLRAGSHSVHSSQRRRSLRSAQKTPLETPSSRTVSSQTKTAVRRHSHGASRAIGKWSHVQAIGHLEEQTPRTLLKNFLLTAPESSIVTPESVVAPPPASASAPALQVVQSSRRESSRSSLQLQLPEIEPTTTLAPGLLAPGRRKQRVRLSVFQQGVDQGLPLSQEPHGNEDASPLTLSSPNLTFISPRRSQSLKRPGLARRPLTRRAVDVGAFLRDLRDPSMALVSPGDSHGTSVAILPRDAMLEDTQPFSPPLVGRSPSTRRSLPCHFHKRAENSEKVISRRTWNGPGLQNNSPFKTAQLLTGRAEEVNTVSVGSSNSSSGLAREGGAEPLADGDEGPAEEGMEEGGATLSVNEEGAGRAQGSAGTEESEGHSQGAEADGSFGTVDSEKLQGASGDQDPMTTLVRPTAPLCTEPPEPQPAKLPSRPRTAGPRPHQDPYKAGLSHYAKLFTFYAKMPMEKAALEMVEKCLDKYFQHLCNDLEVFAAHAGRKTVKPEDLELLLRRQGLVTDRVSLHVLVERYLPLEYRQLLIPCAFSGNSVFPVQ
ncbi:centromere protein T [Rhynchocyon petersi]